MAPHLALASQLLRERGQDTDGELRARPQQLVQIFFLQRPDLFIRRVFRGLLEGRDRGIRSTRPPEEAATFSGRNSEARP